MSYTRDVERDGKLGRYKEVVLCSQSPRRKELLDFVDLSTETKDTAEREIENHYMDLYREEAFVDRVGLTATHLAHAKIPEDIKPSTLYIAADTMVIHHDQIYNKPKDDAEAYDMIRSYFGETHAVVTGVCLAQDQGYETFYTVTEVTFIPYFDQLEELIRDYIARRKPMDKSGAYGLQEIPPLFIEKVAGDPNNVVGLPVGEVARRVFSLGVDE